MLKGFTQFMKNKFSSEDTKDFAQFMKNKFASTEMQKKISARIFASARFKEKGEDFTDVLQPSRTYEMYDASGSKKIGWVKTPAHPWEAGYGWCNLPAYMAMDKIPENRVPVSVVRMEFDEVNPADFGLDEFIRDAEEDYVRLGLAEPIAEYREDTVDVELPDTEEETETEADADDFVTIRPMGDDEDTPSLN